MSDDDDGCSPESGDGVQLAAQYGRHLAEQHVAQDAAADACDGAKDDRLGRSQTKRERLAGAGDAEERQTDAKTRTARCRRSMVARAKKHTAPAPAAAAR